MIGSVQITALKEGLEQFSSEKISPEQRQKGQPKNIEVMLYRAKQSP